MAAIWSFIYDKLVSPLGLPIETWKEWLILIAIELVAYVVAFLLVKKLFQAGEISTSSEGSFLHWLIRLLAFFFFWAVAYGIIGLINSVSEHWWIAPIIVVATLVVVAVIIIGYKRFSKGGEVDA